MIYVISFFVKNITDAKKNCFWRNIIKKNFKLISKLEFLQTDIANQMVQWLGKPAAVPEVPGSNLG